MLTCLGGTVVLSTEVFPFGLDGLAFAPDKSTGFVGVSRKDSVSAI